MNPQTQQWLQQIKRQHATALSSYGDQIVAETKADIDTPYPPASEPDTPPHRRKGYLHDGVHRDGPDEFQVEGVVMHIVSERVEEDPRVPMFLEFGTSKMAARPYMRPSMDRVRESGVAPIASRVHTAPV